VGQGKSKEALSVNDPTRMVWFVGDLDDPWVAEIADALPKEVSRWECAGDLPDEWLDATSAPATLVLHRALLTSHDAEWLATLRSVRSDPPRVVLCVGPHARHAELERLALLVDEVVPEATARDTIARHLHGDAFLIPMAIRSSSPGRCVSVVSDHYEFRETLAEACEAAGYLAQPSRDLFEAAPGDVAIWDVPVLETDWSRGMARRASAGPVVALLGFADRVTVAQARAHGASACLELPVDLADLIFVLDRLAALRVEPAHELPPPPAVRRRRGRASERRVEGRPRTVGPSKAEPSARPSGPISRGERGYGSPPCSEGLVPTVAEPGAGV